MRSTLLSVQFRNLLPSEDLLRFARALWESAQRERAAPFQADATLCIARLESKAVLFEASLALEGGTLRSVATGVEPLATIEAAFAQLRAPCTLRSLRGIAPGESKLDERLS